MTTRADKSKETLRILASISKQNLTLGRLLRAVRMSEEKSLVEFSELLGCSKQQLCDIEHSRRYLSPKLAAAYAKKLGYSEHQFVRLCLQDMVNRDGLGMDIEVKAA